MLSITILGSGSAGNCMIIRYCDHTLMIDAGFSGVEIARRLEAAGESPESICGLLVTHEHDDHIRGLRVFADRHGPLPVYTNALTAERLRYMKKAPERLRIFANGSPFQAGPFQVDAFSVCHDAVDPVGYVLQCGDTRVGIATDFGHPGAVVPYKLKNCDIIVLESNHDPELLRASRRPVRLQNRILGRRGHLSNQLAAQLVPKIVGPRTRHLVMAHLSGECNKAALVEQSILPRLAEIERSDITLQIASQDTVSPRLDVAVSTVPAAQ